MRVSYLQILFYIMMAAYFVFHKDRIVKKAYKRKKKRRIKNDIKIQLLEGIPVLQQIKNAKFKRFEDLDEGGEYIIMEIPLAEGADYGFNIIYELMIDPYIEFTHRKYPKKNFFEYKFLRDGNASEAETLAEMEEFINIMLLNPTKIIQEKGLRSWRYKFYYRKDNEWRLEAKHVSPKRFGAPPIPDKMKEYFSPKVV